VAEHQREQATGVAHVRKCCPEARHKAGLYSDISCSAYFLYCSPKFPGRKEAEGGNRSVHQVLQDIPSEGKIAYTKTWRYF
jgi:hypothetical protein